jgi:Uma2 family endonuclease
MTPQSTHLPLLGIMAGFRRFSVPEYHRLTEVGALTEDDNLELIEGYLVLKMAPSPPHDGTLHRALKRLAGALPAGWDTRIQSAVTLVDSEPEPDLAIVRDDPGGYLSRHPGAVDVGLVIEISDSTLQGDRQDKGRVYARAGIARYWIINLPDRQVEVYTSPSGPVASPAYGQRQDYRPGDVLDFILDGNTVAQVPVTDLLA